MKRYKFSEFYIELTRRCNERCAHCLRGDTQNLTITKEIIDKLFEDAKECLQVYITGGEPLLEPDILLYLIDKIANNWNTIRLTMTTNGSILSEEVVKAFEAFCRTPTANNAYKRRVGLSISDDSYHTDGDCQRAYNFYKPLFDAANQRLNCTEDDPRMVLSRYSPVSEEEDESKGKPVLIYAGRGIDLAKTKPQFKSGKNLKVPNTNYHRLKISNNVVYCTIYISANGNVVLAAEDDSYKTYDSCHSGNILNENLNEIITRHQDSCLLTCNESNFLNSERVRLVGGRNIAKFQYEIGAKFLYQVAMIILKIREAVKKTFPILPAQDIIIGLPMPRSDEEAAYYAKEIFQSIPHGSLPKLDEYTLKRFSAARKKMTKEEQSFCIWIMNASEYMEKHDCSDLFINKLLKTKLGLLENQSRLYKSNVFFPENGWLFPCGSDNIFANRDTRDMRRDGE